jgi:hypothetical protein
MGEHGPGAQGFEPAEVGRVKIATTSGEIELSSGTGAELTRRLRRSTASQPAAAALETNGTAGPVKLDEESRRRIFDELTFWLDHAGASGFPDDARALFRALAGELNKGPGADAG